MLYRYDIDRQYFSLYFLSDGNYHSKLIDEYKQLVACVI